MKPRCVSCVDTFDRAEPGVERHHPRAEFQRGLHRIRTHAVRDEAERDIPRDPCHFGEQESVEGCDGCALVQRAACEKLRHARGHFAPLCGAGGFAFELVMTHRRERIQHFFKRGYALRLRPSRSATACVERCQSTALVASDLAAAVGGALEGLVVNHHQHAVFGEVQVQVHTIDACLQCPAEAGERVLRCLAPRAAVSVDQHAFQSLCRFS